MIFGGAGILSMAGTRWIWDCGCSSPDTLELWPSTFSKVCRKEGFFFPQTSTIRGILQLCWTFLMDLEVWWLRLDLDADSEMSLRVIPAAPAGVAMHNLLTWRLLILIHTFPNKTRLKEVIRSHQLLKKDLESLWREWGEIKEAAWGVLRWRWTSGHFSN